MSTLIGLVENGLGVAVVPQLTLPRQPAAVVGVKLEQPEVTRTIAHHRAAPGAACRRRQRRSHSC